jgi:quercetin dioxygenase-like cupin family protein/DNA-binding XRE family transcriptional regulator
MSSGLSLRELGRRTGVTASLLSQIENGKSDPSVSTLSALVSELGLSLDALLRSEWPGPDVRDGGGSGDGDDGRRGGYGDTGGSGSDGGGDDGRGGGYGDTGGSGSGSDGGGDDGRGGGYGDTGGSDGGSDDGRNGDGVRGHGRRAPSPVIHPTERRTLDLDSGVVWERLTRGPSELMDALLVTYEPGATSSSSGKLLRHGGIERAYLMSGELVLQLGFETYRLRAGDSLEFDAATPHVYCNQGDVPARGLWFVLGRENHPIQPVSHGLLDLVEPGPRDMLSAVDFLEAFSRD